jgi:antitoxin MazE
VQSAGNDSHWERRTNFVVLPRNVRRRPCELRLAGLLVAHELGSDRASADFIQPRHPQDDGRTPRSRRWNQTSIALHLRQQLLIDGTMHFVYTDVYTSPVLKAIMTEVVLDIKQWGNNLGVRLPAAVAREAHLRVDQRVRISVEAGQVVITPVTDVHLTLEQRLARFDPARHGGEVMVTGLAVGAERW